jgi:HAD superfamily hydrolase (TIGR01509 family)
VHDRVGACGGDGVLHRGGVAHVDGARRGDELVPVAREAGREPGADEAARARDPHPHARKLPERAALCYTARDLSHHATRHAVEAVLFDLGGVLVHLDYAAIAAEAARCGVALDPARLPIAEGGARRAIDRRAGVLGGVPGTDATRLASYFDDLLAAAGVSEAAREPVVARLHAHHRDRNLWRVPLAGAAETLAALRDAGLRVGVVSNSDGRVADILAAAGLAAPIEVIVDSHWEGVEKPDAEIFRRALARLGAAAERALFVGDIVSIDVVGARNAGLRAILLDAAGAYGDVDCERIGRLAELPARLGLAGAGGTA